MDFRLQFADIHGNLREGNSVCVDAGFHFKLNYGTPFTVLYNVIACKTAIVSVNVIINSFTQNYLLCIQSCM